jgi:hypothetical protein
LAISPAISSTLLLLLFHQTNDHESLIVNLEIATAAAGLAQDLKLTELKV